MKLRIYCLLFVKSLIISFRLSPRQKLKTVFSNLVHVFLLMNKSREIGGLVKELLKEYAFIHY